EAERARLMCELIGLGWGEESHDILPMWANAFQPGGTISHLRSWAEQMRYATSPKNAARLLAAAWNTDVRETVRKVKCPVLVVHPEGDRVAPIEEGRLLASLLPNSRFVQLDSQNHMPLPNEPEWPRLIEEIRAFLAKPDRAAAKSNGLP